MVAKPANPAKSSQCGGLGGLGSREPPRLHLHPARAEPLHEWHPEVLRVAVHVESLEELPQRLPAEGILPRSMRRARDLIRELNRLLAAAVAGQPADQRAVGVDVRAVRAAPGLDFLEGLDRAVNCAVVDAGAHEARADQRVHDCLVRLPDAGPDSLEGLVQVPALAPHLHDDGDREVGCVHVVLLRHVGEELIGKLKDRMADAAVKQRVEDHRVCSEPSVQHLLEHPHGLRQVAVDAVALDDVGVGDGVGRATILLHTAQQDGGLLHVSVPSLRIDEGGVGDEVHLHLLSLHVAVGHHGPLGVTGACEALDERRVDDSVVGNLCLPLAEKHQGIFDVAGFDECIEHTTERDVVGGHLAVFHHFQPEVPAARLHLQDAARLDEQAVGTHGGLHGLCVHVRLDGLCQADLLPAVDASVQDSVEEHLVLADVDARAVEHRQRAVGVPRVGALP
mmetsp:Transcript_35160/g.95320  ORF Transcript_35160/g.95320 Transcript_35160/m.95320 type:complete len:451 (-) Transcript_35160:1161-2513(-)